MKTQFYTGVLFLLSLSLMSTTCEDDDISSNDNSQQIAEIEVQVSSGTWRITNFNDSGVDETSDFAGYDFAFNTDGSLVATSASNTQTGTWSVTDDSNSNDDSSSDDDIDFNIFFPVPETDDFEDLNDDWDIVSHSATQIVLIDVSGGNGGTDMLTFVRN